jgi:streptogrisin C
MIRKLAGRTTIASLVSMAVLGSAASPPAFVDGDATIVLPPAMLLAIDRDLGLDPAQARARLAREDAARRLADSLRADLGTRFVGAWLDPDDQRLVVAVTDAHAAGTVRSRTATPLVVSRGAAELDATMERLDRATPPSNAVFAWYVDTAANLVVVQADPTALATASAFVKASGADPELVRIVSSTDRPVPQYELRGGDGWGTGVSDTCSIGFSVSRIAAPADVGYVTAGHCATAGQATFANIPGARIAQGVVRGRTFPGSDHAWVQVSEDWTPVALVNRYGSGNVVVTGWNEAPVGATVCRSGITTRWRCGTVTAKNVTVNFEAGTVRGLTRTNACGASGDSGGSVLSGQQAQGTHVAASGTCSSGGTTYFQRLVPALAAYRLRLKTAGSGGTPPVILDMNCEHAGQGVLTCVMSYYHPDPVQIRWTVNGIARPAWNDRQSVTGLCGTDLVPVKVTVSNASGSVSATRLVVCGGDTL